eukprot:7927392-Lingulodinium_polyedra.AAC.1
MAWRGVAWRGVAWHGTAWHGMAQSPTLSRYKLATSNLRLHDIVQTWRLHLDTWIFNFETRVSRIAPNPTDTKRHERVWGLFGAPVQKPKL